jgi:hypothetical protein
VGTPPVINYELVVYTERRHLFFIIRPAVNEILDTYTLLQKMTEEAYIY